MLHRFRGVLAIVLSCVVLAGALPAASVQADGTFQTLPFSQNWSNTGLITTSNNWSGVPGIVGYLGDDASSTAAGVDPQQVLTPNTTVNVIVNQTNPNTNNTGGIGEFELVDPVVALQGSGNADAPSLVISLNTTAQSNIRVSYNLRDIDGSTDNAAQPVALQYRVGTTGDFTNIPAAFVADATTGPSLATLVTPVSVILPAAANNQAQLQLRIITTNAAGTDEWVGIDDISVAVEGGFVITTQPQSQTIASGDPVTLTVAASGGTEPYSYQWYVGTAGDTTNPVSGATSNSYTPSPNLTATTSFWARVTDSAAAHVDSQTATVTVTVPTPTCTITPVTIGSVQGTTDTSPQLGNVVTVQGTVSADFQGAAGLDSFYMQDAGDGNAATSDGIQVYTPGGTDVSVGQVVQVTGTVDEFLGQTELKSVTIESCGTTGTVTPVALTLPLASQSEFERYEGMLVSFNQTLTVQQNYFQGRYGQVTLGVDRLFQPTNLFRPNTPEALALADLNVRSMVVLDDARTPQNPNPIPYMGAGNTLRAGDTTIGTLTGILEFGPINSDSAIRGYRLQPTALPSSIAFTRVNERGAPASVGGNVKVASANVLNYFTTIDQTGAQCYPDMVRGDCRGADSAAEFTRQRSKIINELLTLNADVVGLMEIENNGPTAVGDLVAGLNASAGAGTYAAVVEPTNDPVADTNRLGGDAIKVAMIYQPGTVTPVGNAISSSDTVFSRAPFAQTFRVNATNEVFTVIVNHFKSKGSCPSSGSDVNADKGDGQSCWNALRVEQAEALLSIITSIKQSSGSDDVLVIGDLNSYGKEDPIQTLIDGGLVNELAKRIEKPYSYVFDGLAGYLDHALASASLDAKVTGVTEWHNNADEPSVIDYNTEFKPQDLYQADPFRASDHDPVLIGLQLGGAVVEELAISTQPQGQTIASGASVTLTVAASGGTAPYSYQWYEGSTGDTSKPISGATSSSYTPSPNLTATTSFWVRVTDASADFVDSQTATVTVTTVVEELAISTQPQNQTIVIGASVMLTVAASGGTAPYSYQWYEGSTGDTSKPISGATSNSYTPSPNLTATTSFWVRVTDASADFVDSQTATVTVNTQEEPEPTVLHTWLPLVFK